MDGSPDVTAFILAGGRSTRMGTAVRHAARKMAAGKQEQPQVKQLRRWGQSLRDAPARRLT